MLPYRQILALLRPAATPSTVYRADDGGGDFCQVWVCGRREVLVESLSCEVGRLWLPARLTTAADVRRELTTR